MKRIFLIVTILTFISCEEVIEVEIDNAEPRIVIEAIIVNWRGYSDVTISRNEKYFYSGRLYPISGADITVIENGKNRYIFEDHGGLYWPSQNFQGYVGNHYEIIVNLGEKQYTASSTMPKPLYIDRISAVKRNNPINNKINYDFHCYFEDNAHFKDYARLTIIVNGKIVNRIFTYDDRLTDGSYIDYNRFFLDEDLNISPGDRVQINLYTIDKASFEYFETLKNALAASSGNPFGSNAPANPTTNWSNGALGYFSAHTIDSKQMVIE